MKNFNNKTTSSYTSKRTYVAPQVEKIILDHEISLVMMSPPGDTMPTQDPLMSLKAFKLFK